MASPPHLGVPTPGELFAPPPRFFCTCVHQLHAELKKIAWWFESSGPWWFSNGFQFVVCWCGGVWHLSRRCTSMASANKTYLWAWTRQTSGPQFLISFYSWLWRSLPEATKYTNFCLNMLLKSLINFRRDQNGIHVLDPMPFRSFYRE